MKYLAFLLLILTTGCADTGYDPIEGRSPRSLQIIEYDGCEYVYLRRFSAVSITHKGNCKNHTR